MCKLDHRYCTPKHPGGIGLQKLCTSPSGWGVEATLKELWVTGGKTVLQDKPLKASGCDGCLISKAELGETELEVGKGQILPHTASAACMAGEVADRELGRSESPPCPN